MILNDETQARIEAYEGLVHHLLFNKIVHHVWWDNHDDDKVMVP
jgi:glucose-6-phosphate dehydrogenase assembly protein OpcA